VAATLARRYPVAGAEAFEGVEAVKVPRRVTTERGDTFIVSVVDNWLLFTGPEAARLSRADAEELADALYLAGADLSRAKPITSVEDERVRGNG